MLATSNCDCVVIHYCLPLPLPIPLYMIYMVSDWVKSTDIIPIPIQGSAILSNTGKLPISILHVNISIGKNM